MRQILRQVAEPSAPLPAPSNAPAHGAQTFENLGTDPDPGAVNSDIIHGTSSSAINFDPAAFDLDLDLQSLLAFPAEASFGPSQARADGAEPGPVDSTGADAPGSTNVLSTGHDFGVAPEALLGGAWATGFGALTGHAAPFSWQ